MKCVVCRVSKCVVRVRVSCVVVRGCACVLRVCVVCWVVCWVVSVCVGAGVGGCVVRGVRGVCGVCGVWHAENTVCRFKTLPCVGSKRAHVLNMRAF